MLDISESAAINIATMLLSHKKITEKQLAANLGSYIKKEFRDVTYFRGIDYHMDLIDHANAVGDNLTLYVYLNDVDANMSPLHIIEKSHIFGGTKFPHFLTFQSISKQHIFSAYLQQNNIFIMKSDRLSSHDMSK